MSKYLELVEGVFAQEHLAKQQNQKPYVAYSIKDGKVIYSIVPKEPNYLCLEPIDSNNQLAVVKTISTANTQYSFDKETWNEFPIDPSDPSNPAFVTVDRPIYLKGNNPNGYLNGESLEGSKIIGVGKYNVSGDITTLLNEEGNVTDLSDCSAGCFSMLFGEVKDIKEYPDLYIPAIDIVDASKLILPSTTLVTACYANMFAGCTSLTVAPKLPATTLSYMCYMNMFMDCTSLVDAPELRATELVDGCYGNMFYRCTSLTAAPVLPATTLVTACYANMFGSCTNLNYIKCLSKHVLANATRSWVDGVSSTGVFVKHPDMTSWATGVNGIPSGWTIEDAVL